MVTAPSIVTSDRTATLDATVLRTYQLRVNCVIRPVNCRKQWVGGGDDMTAMLSTTVLQTYQLRVIPVIRAVILRKKYVIHVILY